MSARVGDDVYGEDQEINQFEEYVADLFGKESALFVPSGTMANAIAINLHTRPGDSVLIEENSHCKVAEAGGAAIFSAVQFQEISLPDRFSSESLRKAVQKDGLQSTPTSLLVMENTHNFAGGLYRTADEVALAVEQTKSIQTMATHCDGARIWNAHKASGDSLARLAKPFDSLAVCFSKGLGAPVGSALIGSNDLVTKARKVRKRLGGGMRQAGFLAKAAQFAVQNHLADLSSDHEHARSCALRLKELSQKVEALEIDLSDRATNMVFFRHPAQDVLALRLRERNVLMHHMGNGTFRLVFHRDVSAQMAEQAVAIIEKTVMDLEK